MTLGVWIRISFLPILVMMIMTLSLRLDMVGGAIDSVAISGERVPATSSVVIPTLAASMGVTENIMTRARPKHTLDSEYPFPSQKGQVSVEREY